MDVTYQVTVYTRPPITMRPVPGTNQLELSWPLTDGFRLQEADRPDPDATWKLASVVSTNFANGIQSATVTEPTTGQRFFRLYRPLWGPN